MEARLDHARLGRWLGLANTAGFVFRRFREDPRVQRLGVECPTDQLVSFLRELQGRAPEWSDIEYIEYLAGIVSLSLKSDRASASYLEEVSETPPARWVADLALHARRNQVRVDQSTVMVQSAEGHITKVKSLDRENGSDDTTRRMITLSLA